VTCLSPDAILIAEWPILKVSFSVEPLRFHMKGPVRHDRGKELHGKRSRVLQRVEIHAKELNGSSAQPTPVGLSIVSVGARVKCQRSVLPSA
jgi:hypothetical protein